MHSTTIICHCRKVTYGAIEEAIHHHDNLSNVLEIFDEVQKETKCSTGCGTCHNKILDIIADILNQR